MRRGVVLGLLLLWAGTVRAAERPAVVVLPFSVAGGHPELQGFGLATSLTLTEKLRRVPSVRVLSLRDALDALGKAGVSPEAVARIPPDAIPALRRWLNATVVVSGAIGRGGGHAQQPGGDLWLAARWTDGGGTADSAFMSGNTGDLFNLQNALLAHLVRALGVDSTALRTAAVLRPPARSLEAYRQVAAAEGLFLRFSQQQGDADSLVWAQRVVARARRAIQADSTCAEAYELEGRVFARTGDSSGAVFAFVEASRLDPDFTAPLYGLADLATRHGDLEGAAVALASARDRAPWDARAGRARDRVRPARRDTSGQASNAGAANLAPRAAVAPKTAGKRVSPAPPRSSPDSSALAAGALAKEGRRRVERGDLTSAASAPAQARALKPERAGYWNELGMAYARAGREKAAEAAFRKAASVAPGLPAGEVNLGLLYARDGRTQEAVEAYGRALERDPDCVPARIGLGRAYLAQGRPDKAVAVVERALAVEPRNPDLLVALGNARLAAGDPDAAEQAYRAGLDRAGAAEAGLGNVAFGRGRLAEAEKHFERAIAAAPDDPTPRANLATAYAEQGALHRAEAGYRAALRLAPGDPVISFDLAVVCYRRGEMAEALHWCAESLKRAPDAPETNELAGDVALKTGAYRQAVDAYRKVVRARPNNSGAYRGLASAYENLRDWPAARRCWERWMDLVRKDPSRRGEVARVSRRVRAWDSAGWEKKGGAEWQD